MGAILQKELHNQIWLGQAKYSQDTKGGIGKMKSLKVDDTHHSMLKDLSKRHSMKEEVFLDRLLEKHYSEMKRTGRKVL